MLYGSVVAPFFLGDWFLAGGSALFRVVRLGGHQVREAWANVADALDAADVFLCRDASIAPSGYEVLVFLFPGQLNLLLSGTGFLLLGLCILLHLMTSLWIGFGHWCLSSCCFWCSSGRGASS